MRESGRPSNRPIRMGAREDTDLSHRGLLIRCSSSVFEKSSSSVFEKSGSSVFEKSGSSVFEKSSSSVFEKSFDLV